MKKFIFNLILLFVFFSNCTNVKAKHIFEITSNLRCVKYISESEIITCGENGTILKSIDSGRNWKYINSNTQIHLTDIDILQSDNQYITISGGNSLLFSKDKGKSFSKILIDSTQLITAVLIYNEMTFIIGTHTGEILISTNSGLTWKKLSVSKKRIGDIFLFNDKIYSYDDNNQYYTIDIENQSFIKTNQPTNLLLRSNDTYFYDNNLGVKATGGLHRTIDGGKNWSWVYNDSISKYRTLYNSFLAVDFINEQKGITVGKYNTIFITNDGGLNWELISNFSNFAEQIKIDVFENGEEDIVYFTSDRFTVFKSTNSGVTFLPTNLNRDSTFRNATAGPAHFFDTLNCIYFSKQDLALYHSYDAGATFTNKILLDSADKLNPYKYLVGFDDLFNNGKTIQINVNTLYFYRTQVLEENGIQCKSSNYTYYTTDKGETWNSKVYKTNFSCLNFEKNGDFIYAGGFFIDSIKSIEQGYLSFNAGALKFNNKFEIVDKYTFPEYLLTRSINFIDELNGYALLLDKDYKSNLLYTQDGGVSWTKVISDLDSMYYLSEMILLENKLILTQLYEDLNFKNQTKVLILDLKTYILELIEVNQNPFVVFSPTHLTKNYIYFYGTQINETILNTKKIFRIKRSELNTSIEDYNIENNNVATVWLSNSGANPFTSQTEFTATWLPNTDLTSVTIKVYDLNGIEVADLSNQLINNQFNSNQSKIEFAPINLQSGIYLPVISDKTFRKSISIIYIK